jgi:bacterioferritin-associated ferredoxin
LEIWNKESKFVHTIDEGVCTMNDDTIICTCMNVSVGDIKKAIAAGATDFKSVQDMTGISTVCGLCHDEAEEAIRKLLAERNL